MTITTTPRRPHAARSWLLPSLLALAAAACGDEASEDLDESAGATDTADASTTSRPGETDDPPSSTTQDPADSSSGAGDETDPSSSGDAPPPEPGVLAVDISLRDVEINQGVGITLASAAVLRAEADREAPVISGRGALVRASYEVAPGFVPRDLVGRLWLNHGGVEDVVYADERFVDGPSSWSTLDGAFRFFVDPADIRADTQFRVEVLEPDGAPEPPTPASDARIPQGEDFAPLGAWGDTMVIDLMLVPFSCPGYGQVEISDEDLEDFESYLFNTFPIQELNLEVHDVVNSDNCSEVDAAEYILPAVREADGADPWVYYGGLMPGEGGGYSVAIEDSDQMDFRRTFANHTWRWYGLTFDLFAHELGHSHGVTHTFEDPAFPGTNDYPCGTRSTYGWGVVSGMMPKSGYSNDLELGITWIDPNAELIPPTDPVCDGLPNANEGSFNDMMSYAYPYWVSAYNYSLFADRVRLISSWRGADAQLAPGTTARLLVGPEGDLRSFTVSHALPVTRADAWATCRFGDATVRRPVRSLKSARETPGTNGRVRSFEYTTYELPLAPGEDPADCALDEPGLRAAFAPTALVPR